MELKIGYLLKRGEYRIERVLGQGGFGITYLAEQVSLDRKVAVKEFFMKELCNREGDTSHVTVPSIGSREMVDRFRDKFIKEARALAKLRHRHIVRIIDVFEENNTAYYVMEHIGGGSLGDKVKSGALPEEDAVRYIRQVASALDFVHSRRMMHLDVKPANVLLSDDNDAVLIDFGLAKQYDDAGEQTSSTPVGISHGYAPMEQYKRGGVGTFSPATDIYSLGATLYKLVTGLTPPEANDVANDGLPELPQHLSSNVRAAIEAAMQFRLKERPQSIGEFLEIVESGEVKDDSDGVDDCPPALRGTSAAEGVNDSSATDDGETVVDNHANPVILSASESSVDARRGQSQGTHKHVNREILPPSGRQNDNSGKRRDESGEVRDERKGLGGTSKKKWAIIIAVLVIGAVAALLSTLSGGGSDDTAAERERLAAIAEEQRIEAERLAAEQQRLEQERLAQEAAEQQRLERERKAKEEAERKAAEAAEKKRLEQERLAAERKAKEEAERKAAAEAAEQKRKEEERKRQEAASNSFSTRTFTVSGVSFKMVAVEGGTFTMGATSEQQNPYGDEKPVHNVTLSSYYIGETEVTQALWKAVMGSNPSIFSGSNNPVETVSYDDCITFINKLNSLLSGQLPTGRKFRLPTEAEWEYAARGGNRSRGYQYSGSDNFGSVAWYDSNSGSKTHPVKQKQPNELGLYDMSGNVYEWCADWYEEDYYQTSPEVDPQGPVSVPFRVLRGGSWDGDAWLCRLSHRDWNDPVNGGYGCGLRLSL